MRTLIMDKLIYHLKKNAQRNNLEEFSKYCYIVLFELNFLTIQEQYYLWDTINQYWSHPTIISMAKKYTPKKIQTLAPREITSNVLGFEQPFHISSQNLDLTRLAREYSQIRYTDSEQRDIDPV